MADVLRKALVLPAAKYVEDDAVKAMVREVHAATAAVTRPLPPAAYAVVFPIIEGVLTSGMRTKIHEPAIAVVALHASPGMPLPRARLFRSLFMHLEGTATAKFQVSFSQGNGDDFLSRVRQVRSSSCARQFQSFISMLPPTADVRLLSSRCFSHPLCRHVSPRLTSHPAIGCRCPLFLSCTPCSRLMRCAEASQAIPRRPARPTTNDARTALWRR